MNYSTLTVERLLCRVFQEEVTDKTYILVSASLLSLIGILGIIGNALVLLVYCQSPLLWCFCCCRTAYPHCSPRFRKGLQHSQRKLLIALAVVDLLTATIVLPCDISHKIFTLLNIRIYCDLNVDNLAYGLIDNARNVMFALEGSILTSIAIDRFLVIGCPYVRNISNKWRAYTYSVSELASGQTSSPDMLNEPTSPQITGTEDIHTSTEVAPQVDFKLSHRSERQTQSVLLPRTPSKLHRQLCVLLPITITTSILLTFEVAVFALHIQQHRTGDKSLSAARLRYFLNRLYLISTIITFPFVCGPYVFVFLAIRSLDKKRARLHRDGSARLTRSRRTALTLFIATLVFYLTLLPVLIVHFGNWSNDSGTREDIAKDVHMHFSAAYIHHEFYYINNAKPHSYLFEAEVCTFSACILAFGLGAERSSTSSSVIDSGDAVGLAGKLRSGGKDAEGGGGDWGKACCCMESTKAVISARLS
eukprot:TsM_000464800 transcript=TsM_000464800 gene=TsM_000464800